MIGFLIASSVPFAWVLVAEGVPWSFTPSPTIVTGPRLRLENQPDRPVGCQPCA